MTASSSTGASSTDVALIGGRLIDPESGLDAVRNVTIAGGRIDAITEHAVTDARQSLDVTGLVVAPGFIDLHSHGHTIAEHRLQAFDGVTTVLDLEAGRSPVDAAYSAAAAEGRPLNFGFSASWALTRMAVVAGIPIDGRLEVFFHNISIERWQRPASARQLGEIIDGLSADLDAGALGIGILMGYAPEVDPAEYVAVATLAASAGTPTFTHSRDLIEYRPDLPIDGANEVVRTASETGAHMHYCHINSTSRRHIDRVHSLIEHAQAGGARVTTEAYPYGTGMTAIGAEFLSAENLAYRGLVPSSIVYAPTGERVADAARLTELRQTDPGGLAIMDLLDENDPADLEYLRRSLLFPDAVVASDAMPITWRDGQPDIARWPLPPEAITHPRTAGTFSKALRWLVRESSDLTLNELIRRASTMPAQLLADTAPGMRRKGRIQPRSDADVIVFDPAAVSDQASYADSTRPSTGFRHVLVNGTFVIRDGQLVTDAMPGRPVLNTRRTNEAA